MWHNFLLRSNSFRGIQNRMTLAGWPLQYEIPYFTSVAPMAYLERELPKHKVSILTQNSLHDKRYLVMRRGYDLLLVKVFFSRRQLDTNLTSFVFLILKIAGEQMGIGCRKLPGFSLSSSLHLIRHCILAFYNCFFQSEAEMPLHGMSNDMNGHSNRRYSRKSWLIKRYAGLQLGNCFVRFAQINNGKILAKLNLKMRGFSTLFLHLILRYGLQLTNCFKHLGLQGNYKIHAQRNRKMRGYLSRFHHSMQAYGPQLSSFFGVSGGVVSFAA